MGIPLVLLKNTLAGIWFCPTKAKMFDRRTYSFYQFIRSGSILPPLDTGASVAGTGI
jgi:hypothetical protein